MSRVPTLVRLLAALAPLAAAACGGGAPAPDAPVSMEITPTSGPPGTTVQMEARGFPADTTVDLGMGPPQSEYEVLAQARTDAEGRVNASVTVPDWVEGGRDYVFVVVLPATEPGARERAVSGPFTVEPGAGATGPVTAVGLITDEGVECPALRADDGTLYTLTGDLGTYQMGDTVRVVGRVAEMSICMQGTTLAVDSIARAGGD